MKTQTKPKSSLPTSVKTAIASFDPRSFAGNQSGIVPVTDNVLVLPDTPKKQSEGGILIPESSQDRHALAAESGVLIAIGPDAFLWNTDRTRRLESGEKPQAGERVFFNRYAAIVRTGADGEMYFIMSDSSIKAVERG